MSVVGGWLLLVGCCLVFVVCHSFVACCSLCAVCCLLFVNVCVLCEVCCLLRADRWLLLIV